MNFSFSKGIILMVIIFPEDLYSLDFYPPIKTDINLNYSEYISKNTK